jgi:cobalt-zinc-cadmium efflux system membrane fusion protein
MTVRGDTARRQVIPATAVVREDDKEHIFVQLGPDTFLLRQVQLGGEFEGKRVVLEGLKPGEKIVLDGAFHLNNERRRQMLRGSEGA